MFERIRHSLIWKLILSVGLVLAVSISIWAYFNIDYQKRKLIEHAVAATDRLTNTIRLGTYYAMMLNSRDDINQIITNIGKLPEIENIRIYNKEGQIKFSNRSAEVDRTTNIKDEACTICHRTEPPRVDLNLDERTRFISGHGVRRLGIITPIRNEPGCSTGDCHFHPRGKKILGALDVVISLEETDLEILKAEKGILGLSVFILLLTSAIIFVFLFRFVSHPIKRLIEEARSIGRGEYSQKVRLEQEDEMGQLAEAINRMSDEIGRQQSKLNRQRDEYQELFERVPCLITVQDRNFQLLRFNREFARLFDPEPGDYCYHAYKGRDSKCVNCPVEKTFENGRSHNTEESGVNKDGSPAHWIVRTSPIRDPEGRIVAAMEISLDITDRMLLQVELEKSEKKYHAFFSNIPNPVFVLDAGTLSIIDCNESVRGVYGYEPEEMIQRCFLDLFPEGEGATFRDNIRSSTILNRVRHLTKEARPLFVNIRISPAEYSEKQVYLVTISDITKRLEAEQQLIQASKMATLGEMATGVAHELNQPLSVMKTASSFLIRKLDGEDAIHPETLDNLLRKIDGNIDRATNIIHHMRQFARKSDLKMERVQVNDILASAFEIFSQQLKVRGIEVVWKLSDSLPLIEADPGRLEQVFINLLLNARDAIEEHWQTEAGLETEGKEGKLITICSYRQDGRVCCEVKDTGCGIPDGIAEKIFEPFFTTKEVGKGTGLGLSISYGIVKDCRGRIEAFSRKEDGTSFVVSFPIPEKSHDG